MSDAGRPTKARKGDFVAYEKRTSIAYQDRGPSVATSVHLAEVVRCARDGQVVAIRPFGSRHQHLVDRRLAASRRDQTVLGWRVLHRNLLRDPDALEAAERARPDAWKGWPTYDDARAWLRPLLDHAKERTAPAS